MSGWMPEANEHTQLKEAVLARNVRRACAMSHAHNQNSLDVVRAVLSRLALWSVRPAQGVRLRGVQRPVPSNAGVSSGASWRRNHIRERGLPMT